MGVKARYRKIKRGGRSYYLDIVHNGERWYEPLDIRYLPGESSLEDVKNLVKAAEGKRSKELYQGKGVFLKKAVLTDFFSNYAEAYAGKDYRKINAVSKIVADLFPERRLAHKFSEADVLKFKQYIDEKYERESAISYLGVFKKIIRKAVREGVLRYDIASDVKGWKKPQTLNKDILTHEEIKLIEKTHCDSPMVKQAFLFACFTALGNAEIRSLKWSQIQNDTILKHERRKTRTTNAIPLSANALRFLPQRRGDLVFPDLPTDNGMNKTIKALVKRAGIDKEITFYCARHTAATMLLWFGVDLETVSRIMGHTSLETTRKYVHLVDERKRKAVNAIPVL